MKKFTRETYKLRILDRTEDVFTLSFLRENGEDNQSLKVQEKLIPSRNLKSTGELLVKEARRKS